MSGLPGGEHVAKWIGFNEGAEVSDPSYVPTAEPENYMKHVQEKEAELRRKQLKRHQAADNTTE